MSEDPATYTTTGRKVYSLEQLTRSIKKVLDNAIGDREFWIRAEITSLNHHNSGHTYLILSETRNNRTVAEIKATIWASQMLYIEEALGGDLPNILKKGSETECRVAINYHQRYGLSLSIKEIDTSFNLGVLEQRKQATIKRLNEEKLMTQNSLLILPRVIQRVALIASPGTSGWADFMEHIRHNEHGYHVEVEVFEATVQGDVAITSMLGAFHRIDADDFDIIAFIRGGGSKLDLEPFNNYDLAAAVARSPLPVMTGIGHETDLSVLDMVAHTHQKTPTALSDFILDRMGAFEQEMVDMYRIAQNEVRDRVYEAQKAIQAMVKDILSKPVNQCQLKRGELHSLSNRLVRHTREILTTQTGTLQQHQKDVTTLTLQKVTKTEPDKLNQYRKDLHKQAQHIITLLQQRVSNMQQTVNVLSPTKTLARGFSITRKDGKAITSSDQVQTGDLLTTHLAQGTITSIVKAKTK